MKRLFFLGIMVILGLAGGVAYGQFSDYGVRASLGLATTADDLGTKAPILGVTIGGYVNYTFESSENVMADVFYLQSGLNLTRRGSSFEENYESASILPIRTGHQHIYYLQLPILACFHFELPIRQRGHVVGFFLGPALNLGLFGSWHERIVTPGYGSDHSVNYDEKGNLFDHAKRFDLSALLGVTYEYRDFVFSLYSDIGFFATTENDDIMSLIANANAVAAGNSAGEVRKVPGGHNAAYLLSVSYRLGSF